MPQCKSHQRRISPKKSREGKYETDHDYFELEKGKANAGFWIRMLKIKVNTTVEHNVDTMAQCCE